MSKIKKPVDKNFKLKPLSPVNDLGMEDHSYASCKEYLDDAFENPRIRNIAFSGNFGAGKSSILHSYDKHRNHEEEKFLYISLTDFQNYECDCKSKKESASSESQQGEPEQAEEDINDKDGEQKRKDSEKEDPRQATQKRVEYSLLCQILARCQRRNLLHSSLSGIPEAPTTFLGALFGGVLAALICALIFHDYFGRVAKLLGYSAILRGNIHSWLYVVLAGMVCLLVIHCLRHGKIQKIALKATNAEAEVALSQTQTSLDLYKFELIHTLVNLAPQIDHTVVFEDMDRLDPQICVAVITKLRDLNVMVNTRQDFLAPRRIRFQLWLWRVTEKCPPLRWLKRLCRRLCPRCLKRWMLNHFPSLVRGNAHIRFIYAVGEDILDHNLRTKFYDCIIPVTPALNLFNAEDVLCEILKENDVDIKGEKTWSTVKQIIPYLNDYRTLRTLSNEFRVLRSQFKGSAENNDFNNATMLALTFYKVMAPKKYSQLFDEYKLKKLPKVSEEDFPELKDANYRKDLVEVLDKISPSEHALQLLFLSREKLCARWIAALRDGPLERTEYTIKEIYHNDMVDISAEIKENRLFEATDDTNISSFLASYIYRKKLSDNSFDDWLYTPGNPEEHKFTSCMAFLTSTGQIEGLSLKTPQVEPAALFDWCLLSLPYLRSDIGHEKRWNTEMTGLLETILSTQYFNFSEELLNIPITENKTVQDLISWDLEALDEEASKAVQAEKEMLEIVNRLRNGRKNRRKHITRNGFVDFCKNIFNSDNDAAKQDLAESVWYSANIDISKEVIDNQIIEYADDEIVIYCLISHLWNRMDQGAFDHWFFRFTDPKYEKFAKCISWMYMYGSGIFTDRLFDWCIENLKVLVNPDVPRSCWNVDNMKMLGILLRSDPARVPERIKAVVLFDGISVAELLEDDGDDDDTTEESLERSLAELK